MAVVVSDETWAEIEKIYETTHETEVALARRFGIHHFAVYQRAKAQKWKRPASDVVAAPRVDDAIEAPAGPVAGTPKVVRKKKSPTRRGPRTARAARDDLILRMYRAIGTKLTKLEERMADEKKMKPEESERHTRELGSMIAGFEKITEVATDAAKSDAAAGPVQPVVTSLADIERVRRELAQRLHRAWGRKNP